MPLCTDDCKTSCCTHFRRKLDVGTTAGHIGGDGYYGFLSGLCYDFSLFLVQFGVEHVVWDAALLEHTAEQFGDFDGGGSDKHRAAFVNHLLYLLDYGIVFFFFSLVYAVVHVYTRDRTVSRDGDYVELVDIPELASLCLGRTGHAGKFVVHAEVVLQRDGGESLCGSLHLHAFLGLDGLMQTVAVAAAFHNTSGLLVDDFHLVVVDDVFYILVEQGICLEQLVDGMYAFSLYCIVLHQRVFLFLTLFVAQRLVLKCRELCGDVGKHEELWVVA